MGTENWYLDNQIKERLIDFIKTPRRIIRPNANKDFCCWNILWYIVEDNDRLSILETEMLFWCQQNTRNFAIHKRVYVVIFKITLLTYFAKKTLTSMRSIFRLRLLMTTSQAFVMHHLSIHISQHFVDNVTQSCLMFNSVTHSIGNVILLVLKHYALIKMNGK